jgi:hypothetical protein
LTSLTHTIQKLKASPLFYLFLSSRELFHTNFWLWLSEVNKKQAIQLFSKKVLSDDKRFIREHNQKFGEHKAKIDLYIEGAVVVENKVKDFPSTEQMQRIKQAFEGKDVEFVLATLFWFEELTFEDWKIMTYLELSEKINPERFTQDPYHLHLINDYKSFLKHLAELAEQLQIKPAYNFAIAFETEIYRQLNSIKLWEGYQKMRASHLLYQYKKHNIHGVKTGYSVNNQKATIDFVVQLTEGYNVGIQIENDQYRKFISGKNAAGFASALIQNDVFLNKHFQGRGKKPFLNYGEHFKYQYEVLESALTFDELFACVNKDIADILKNKEALKSLISNPV